MATTHPRARRPALTSDRILGAAMAVADRSGVSAVSMRTVGNELGVEAMSLYHHVANKDALLDALVDRIFEGIDLPEPGESWREAMRERALSARSRLATHPWALGLMESRRIPGPALLRHHDAVLGSLRAGGFSVAQAAHAFSLIDAYVYGFVLNEANLPFETTQDVENLTDELLRSTSAPTYPHLVELISQLPPGYSYGDEFEFGLELVLDALESRLDT